MRADSGSTLSLDDAETLQPPEEKTVRIRRDSTSETPESVVLAMDAANDQSAGRHDRQRSRAGRDRRRRTLATGGRRRLAALQPRAPAARAGDRAGRGGAVAAAGGRLRHPARRTARAAGGRHRPVADAVAAPGQVGVAGAGGQRAGLHRGEGKRGRPDAPRAGPGQRRRRAQAGARGQPVRQPSSARSRRWSSVPTRAPRPCWPSRRS